jgi:hypothetical protein
LSSPAHDHEIGATFDGSLGNLERRGPIGQICAGGHTRIRHPGEDGLEAFQSLFSHSAQMIRRPWNTTGHKSSVAFMDGMKDLDIRLENSRPIHRQSNSPFGIGRKIRGEQDPPNLQACLPLILLDRHDRHCDGANRPFGHAPKKHSLKATISVCAHHDQLDIRTRRKICDHLDGIAFFEHGREWNSPNHEIVAELVQFATLRLAKLIKELWHDAFPLRNRRQIERMNQPYPCTRTHGETTSPDRGSTRIGREIDRGQYRSRFLHPSNLHPREHSLVRESANGMPLRGPVAAFSSISAIAPGPNKRAFAPSGLMTCRKTPSRRLGQ